MSVVITTYTLASGLMQQGMTWWQAMLHHPARQRDRPRADDPERARRHEVRHLVSGAVPRQLRRARRERPGDPARASSPAAGSASRRGSAGSRSTRCSPRRGPAGRACRAASGSRSRSSGSIEVCDHRARPRRHQDARGLVGAAAARRRRRCCWSGRSRRGGGLGHILAESRAAADGAQAPFWQLFPAALTANVGYWATLSLNIPDFTRYARSQRSQALGQALGLPTTMTAFAFIGVAVTSATIVIFGEAIWDPVELIARIGSAAGDHLRRAGRPAARSCTTNMAANVVSPANDFSSLRAAAHQLRHRRPDHRGHRHR